MSITWSMWFSAIFESLWKCFSQDKCGQRASAIQLEPLFLGSVNRDFGVMHFKYTLYAQEPLRLWFLHRRGRIYVQGIESPKSYLESLKIDNKKYKDILDML